MASYDEDIHEQVDALFADAVWQQPPTWYLFEETPSLHEVWCTVKEREIDLAISRAHGKTEDEVDQDIADRLYARLQEAKEIKKLVEALGFKEYHTGGGSMAYRYDLPWDGKGDDGPPHFLLTDSDAGLPILWGEEAVFGYYADDSDTDGDSLSGTTNSVYAKLLDGTALPEWPKPSSSGNAGPYDAKDIETINAHRRSIGGGELDLSAGWTSQEIREMAENIRTKGRTYNPRHAELKRKLMR